MITIITNSRNRDSFRELFKNIENIFTHSVYFFIIICSKKQRSM